MPFLWFLFIQALRALLVNRATLWLGKTKLGIWIQKKFDIILNKIVKTKKIIGNKILKIDLKL